MFALETYCQVSGTAERDTLAERFDEVGAVLETWRVWGAKTGSFPGRAQTEK